MEKTGARINLVLLDACRDNPFRDQGVRSGTGGLAQMQAPLGTLISFVTQPRSVRSMAMTVIEAEFTGDAKVMATLFASASARV
jgi:uncharacterized caspase-like protein